MDDEELKAILESGAYEIIAQRIQDDLAAALDGYIGDPLKDIKGRVKDMDKNFLTVVTYYGPEDVEFMGDYHSVEIIDSTGVVVMNYGDHYHDNGRERAKGFIEGVVWVYPDYRDKIGYEQKNIVGESSD